MAPNATLTAMLGRTAVRFFHPNDLARARAREALSHPGA